MVPTLELQKLLFLPPQHKTFNHAKKGMQLTLYNLDESEHLLLDKKQNDTRADESSPEFLKYFNKFQTYILLSFPIFYDKIFGRLQTEVNFNEYSPLLCGSHSEFMFDLLYCLFFQRSEILEISF